MVKSEPKCLLCSTDLQNIKLQRSIEPISGEDAKNIPEKLLNKSGNDELVHCCMQLRTHVEI